MLLSLEDDRQHWLTESCSDRNFFYLFIPVHVVSCRHIIIFFGLFFVFPFKQFFSYFWHLACSFSSSGLAFFFFWFPLQLVRIAPVILFVVLHVLWRALVFFFFHIIAHSLAYCIHIFICCFQISIQFFFTFFWHLACTSLIFYIYIFRLRKGSWTNNLKKKASVLT